MLNCFKRRNPYSLGFIGGFYLRRSKKKHWIKKKKETANTVENKLRLKWPSLDAFYMLHL
jgi:hypothetical protein